MSEANEGTRTVVYCHWCRTALSIRAASNAGDLDVSSATHKMIVYQTCRLHEGVADRRPDKAETPLPECFRQGIGLAGPCGNVPQRAPAVHLWRAADEAPDELIEAAGFALDFEKGAGVRYRTFDLEPVAHDAGVGEQAVDAAGIEARDLGCV